MEDVFILRSATKSIILITASMYENVHKRGKTSVSKSQHMNRNSFSAYSNVKTFSVGIYVFTLYMIHLYLIVYRNIQQFTILYGDFIYLY